VKAALLLLSLSSAAWAGPWGPGRWHFYAQLRESVELADQRFDADGNRAPIRVPGLTPVAASYRRALSDLYVEVGLAARLSLLADFRFFNASWEPAGNLSRQASGLSDLFLGAKLLLFDDELSAALQCGLWAPIGSATGQLPLGPGDVRGDFMLLIGKLFEHPSLFISAELGVELRSSAKVADPSGMTFTQQYSHQLRYAAAAGYSWLARRRALQTLVIALKLEGAYALDAATEDGLGLLEPRAGTYLKLGPELTWVIAYGVQLALGGHTFVAGRALPALSEIALALGWSH
jgi:hypothetical protein